MAFERYTFKGKHEKATHKRTRKNIPWLSFKVGDVWLCIGQTKSSIMQGIKNEFKRGHEYSYIEGRNGIVIRREN